MQNTLDEEIRCMDRLNNVGEWTKMNECLDEQMRPVCVCVINSLTN